MDELITVIILMFNSMEYIYDCLKSVCNQTYSNIEIIIGDDGSFEFSRESLEQYIILLKKKNIRYIDIYQNENNIGIVKNYTKALQRSHGEYIFYLAADDTFFDENVLVNVYHFFKKTNYKIVSGYRQCFDSIGNQYMRPRPFEILTFDKMTSKQKFNRILQKNIIAGACTPFHKSTINEFYKLENYYHLEDWPRYLNVLLNNIDIGLMKLPLIRYRIGGLTSYNTDCNLVNDYFKLFSKYMNNDYDNVLINILNSTTLIAIWENSNLFKEYKKKKSSFLKRIHIHLPISNIHSLNKYSKPYFILVFANASYYQIANQLEYYGFKEGLNFSRIFYEKILYIQKVIGDETYDIR